MKRSKLRFQKDQKAVKAQKASISNVSKAIGLRGLQLKHP